jgi:hypothetical protein
MWDTAEMARISAVVVMSIKIWEAGTVLIANRKVQAGRDMKGIPHGQGFVDT